MQPAFFTIMYLYSRRKMTILNPEVIAAHFFTCNAKTKNH